MLINGRYRVIETLGGGSHASVFHVLDLRHDEKPIALKLLHHDRPSELLRWEFSQLRRQEHPNLARVYDLDTIEGIEGERPDSISIGALFLTQDLVVGQPADVAVLPRRSDPGALDQWVVSVTASVCRALAYLHVRGIVHRDVKPANVIVGDDPLTARLIDLSLSKGGVLGAGRGPAGSLAFMAPEAMAGAAEPRSDLFSLGVSMQLLLSGRLPFGELGADTAATVRAILDGHPRALRDDAPHVSEGLSAVVASLLAPAAHDRPPSARAVLIELGRRFGPDAVGLDEGLTGAVDVESEVVGEEHDWAALARTGVLIGRERELGLLSTLLDERLDVFGRGSPVMVVVGPAGVGKSALLREVTQRLQLRAAASGAPAPLILRGSIRHVASTLRDEMGRDVRLPRLSSWLGEGVEGLPAMGVEAKAPDATALCEELSSLVVAATKARPVVLHLEDEPRGIADDFIAFLHRCGEVEALTAERRPPLSVVLERRVEPGQQLSVPDGVAVVELRPLADDDIRRIIDDRLGQAVREPVISAAVSAARGRPLLLFAFLSRAASLGPLRQLDETALSTLQAERERSDELEPDVADVLAGMVKALPEPQRAALLALALWGRAAGAKELAALLDISVDESAKQLGELWRRGTIELDTEGRVQPVAPDLAALVRRLQGDRWVESIHGRALELLEKSAPGEIAARARHARAAAHPSAAQLSAEAGEELLAAGDPVAAIAHTEAALGFDEADVRERATIILRRALLAAGRYDRAVELWTAAIERSETGARGKLAQALRLAGRSHAAQGCAMEELEALEVDPDTGSVDPGWETRALLARLELDRGEARAALEFVGTSEPGDARGEGAAAFEETAGLARLALGDIDGASARFQACMTLARDGRATGHDRDEATAGSGGMDKNLASRAHNLLGMVAHHEERWSEAGAHYAEAEALARAVGHAHAAATSGVNVAVARLEAGELGEALSPLRRAIATLAGIGSTGELAGALYNYGSLLMALGDIESGLRVHERALAAARKAGARHVEAYCSLLLGDLHRRKTGIASIEAAHDAYAMAIEQFEVLEAPREQCFGRLLLSEMLASMGRTTEAVFELGRAAALLPVDSSPALSARLALTRARLALAGAGSIDEATTKLTDSMRIMRGLEQLDLRWRGELALARLLARRGERKGAIEALDEAERILAQLAEHVPDQYRPLWSSDPEREPLEGLEMSLGEARETPPNQQVASQPRSEDPLPLQRLLAINKRLNSELRLSRLLDEIIDTIIELTDAERGFLLLKGKDDVLRPRSARNMDRISLASDDMRVSRSIAEQVVETGEAVVTVDAQSDGRFETASSVHALRLRSILAVPLRVKGTVVGAVYVDDRVRPGAFGEGALQLALNVADQAAIAIENARLHNENRRRQRKIEGLNRRLQRELDRQKVELDELRRELDGQRKEMATKYSYDAIVARSAAMNKLFRILDRVTDSEVPVVIQGESGTGKELCARAIHFNGPRSERPFVTENCGAIPETLLESILFGHMKGAFTGADRTRPGLFEVASGGTLLLDEISEMSPAMQSKLLRVLQEGELRPVGGSGTVQVDVRVITSSNRDLGELVRRSAFREDLYYRLNVITVRLPSLRERPEDIPILVEHFIKKHGGERVVGVDRTALKRLAAYGWPGNVRQLENEIMRSIVLADDIIREEHLTPEIAEGDASGRPDDLDIKGHVAQLEMRLIRAALDRFKGNQSRAASALCLSRYGLQKKMARYGLTARR